MRVVSFLVAGIVGGLTALSSGAMAQTSACPSLLDMYRVAKQSGGGGGRVSAESVAKRLVDKQADALQHGCAGFSSGARAGGQCQQIMGEIRALRGQLAAAQAGGSGGAPRFNIAAIEQRLAQNGCAAQPRQRSAQATSPGRGTSRTLCVRLCDGYYFPISPLSRRDRQKVDAEVCQSLYAGAGQAELFLQRPNADVAAAVSIDGKSRYGDKPYAFRFRDSFQPLCQKQLKSGVAALAVRYDQALATMPADPKGKARAASTASSAPTPLPRMRPAGVGEDPETVASRVGALMPARFVFADYGPPSMRYVGEAYYPALHDPNGPQPAAPTYRPPLGFDLIASARAREAAIAGNAEIASQ